MPHNKPSHIPLTEADTADLRKFISRGNGFFHIGRSEIPLIIPGGLREKWDSAMVIISGSTGPNGAIALIGHRPDYKSGKLDQDPFVLATSASSPRGSGVLVHHASFPSRSQELPIEFCEVIGSSGIVDYFKTNPPYGLSSGSTQEIPQSLVQALEIAKEFLRPSSGR